MQIIHEAEVSAAIATLDRAWSQPETFAFVPSKSPVPTEWIAQSLEIIPPEFAIGHFVLLTSGSTGQPKLIVGARHRAEALAQVLHGLQRSELVQRTVLLLPLSYCYAFVNQWLWARCLRRALEWTAGFSRPDRLKDTLVHASEAMVCLVGVQVPLLLRHFAGAVFPGIIRVHFAGGRFPQEQLGDVRRLFPNALIFNNYGCAEAMPRLTLRRAEDGDSATDIGSPLPGVELRSDDNGELTFRSAYGAVGYVDAGGFHTITAETWVSTGDIGEAGPNGRWLLTGRAHEVFKRHGEKIALPALLATVNERWPGQAVFYRDVDAAGENGHVLVLAPDPTPEALRSVLLAFRASHPRAHWPLRIESVSALPVLANGKVDTAALPALAHKTIHWHQRI